MALFRYYDLPGMMGHVGTVLGERGVNISSAAVGRQPPGDDGRRNEVAVMVVTTDTPVPRDVVAEIARSDGFLAGRAAGRSGVAATATAHGRRVAALHHLPQPERRSSASKYQSGASPGCALWHRRGARRGRGARPAAAGSSSSGASGAAELGEVCSTIFFIAEARTASTGVSR